MSDQHLFQLGIDQSHVHYYLLLEYYLLNYRKHAYYYLPPSPFLRQTLIRLLQATVALTS